jgi:hypothetical protein
MTDNTRYRYSAAQQHEKTREQGEYRDPESNPAFGPGATRYLARWITCAKQGAEKKARGARGFCLDCPANESVSVRGGGGEWTSHLCQ